MNKNVVILKFSTRARGNCTKIGAYLENYYKRTNVCSYSVEIQPCGECDYECLDPAAVCPRVTESFRQIMDAVCASDLTYFVIPNYCGYPCAAYFAFNERTVGYFNMDRKLLDRYLSVKKRFIVVSNTEGDSFRNALQQQTNEEPDIFYLKSGKYQKRSTAGDILESQDAVAELKNYLNQYRLSD